MSGCLRIPGHEHVSQVPLMPGSGLGVGNGSTSGPGAGEGSGTGPGGDGDGVGSGSGRTPGYPGMGSGARSFAMPHRWI